MSGGVEIVSAFTGVAIQAAIDKVATDTGSAGGIVLLPPGVYTVSAPITAKSKVTLQGSGKQTTVLQAAGDNTVFQIHGTASANATGGINNHLASVKFNDLSFDGGSNASWSTKPLVSMYYVHTAEFNSVVWRNKFGIGLLVGAEVWDTTWTESRWDNCGGVNQGLPAMLVQSADGATFPAFGSSTDATNDLRFIHCTWESFRDGAFWTANPTGSNSIGGLYFVLCKIDENNTALGPWVVIDKVEDVEIGMDIAVTGAGAAWNLTPYDLFTFTRCVSVSVKIKGYLNSAAANSIVTFDGSTASNTYVAIEKLRVRQIGSGSTKLATAVMRFVGANSHFEGLEKVVYIGSSPTAIMPLFSGTVPISRPLVIREKAGTFSDTDFGTQEPGQPAGAPMIVGIDTTNNTLTVRTAAGVYKKAALT